VLRVLSIAHLQLKQPKRVTSIGDNPLSVGGRKAASPTGDILGQKRLPALVDAVGSNACDWPK
jgi:hypothetical protein